ncbi:MAG TPA: TetR/AcrR family transcriptional regulator [Geminicoccaceae bacterium]|nr:TetR/AcrR family transcriptional regulator [Geminicoccaceae bacterium]
MATPLRAAGIGVAARAVSLPKHDAILDAARRVFLREGYSASMDLVAAEAGVSKQTVYNHFGSKEGLFRAIVDHASNELLDVLVERDGARADPAAALEMIARRFLALLLAPSSVALHRMLVAEAPRFPDLAREIYLGGPARAARELALYLGEESRKRTLAVADPALAAEQFFGALCGHLHLRALLIPREAPRAAEIERAIAHAVRGFLRAHAAPV